MYVVPIRSTAKKRILKCAKQLPASPVVFQAGGTPLMLSCYKFCGHPPMCSMSLNIDPSNASTGISRRERTLRTKKALHHEQQKQAPIHDECMHRKSLIQLKDESVTLLLLMVSLIHTSWSTQQHFSVGCCFWFYCCGSCRCSAAAVLLWFNS